jgi:hypothetical protein
MVHHQSFPASDNHFAGSPEMQTIIPRMTFAIWQGYIKAATALNSGTNNPDFHR